MPKTIRLAALTLLSTLLPLLATTALAAEATDKPDKSNKSDKSDKSEADSSTPSAADLSKQRIESAQKAAKLAEQLYRNGNGTAEDVQLWTQRWLQARLEGARGREERIAILKEFVDLAKNHEQLAEQRYKAGLTNALEVEAAHYFRLDAELRLARRTAEADGGERGGPRAAAGGDSQARKDEQALQGKWKVVRKMKNGAAEDEGQTIYLTFHGHDVSQTHGDAKSEGTFALDASKTPRHITLTGTSGEKAGTTFAAIYELDGNTLKLAYSTGDNAGRAPKDFSGGEGCGLLVLQRQSDDRTDRKE